MKILATDLDRTLLPNGHWAGDPQAIEMFNELTAKHGTFVVYVTGRNLDLTEKAIAEYGVRHPDVLCGDVATTIRRYEQDRWTPDPGWDAHVRRASPRWDAADDQVVANVKQAQERDPALTVYFAKGDFRGLSGYYTSGVIEGAYHYGLFS